MSDDCPQDSPSVKSEPLPDSVRPSPEEAERLAKSGENPELVLSEPYNARGDRLLIEGTRGPIQKMAQHRERAERIQAEERILTFLEGIPGLMDVIPTETRDQLVGTVRSLCHQTAKEYLERFFVVAKGIETFLPTFGAIPDPRDPGPMLAKVGENSGQNLAGSLDSDPRTKEVGDDDKKAKTAESESETLET